MTVLIRSEAPVAGAHPNKNCNCNLIVDVALARIGHIYLPKTMHLISRGRLQSFTQDDIVHLDYLLPCYTVFR